jgi:hypothetical protein
VGYSDISATATGGRIDRNLADEKLNC